MTGSLTAEYLDARAAESFKRQTDLEESIWRSLPLLTGGLIAAGAIVTNAARALPQFNLGWFALVTSTMLALAVVAFVIAFGWLVLVVYPRDYDYPPDDAKVVAYAEAMRDFHLANGVDANSLDAEVVRELRLYLATAFATSARSTFANNQRRLSARSQVIVFLLSGFLLTFACDATIFGIGLYHQVQSRIVHASRFARCPVHGIDAGSSGSATPAGNPRRRVVDETDNCAAGPRQDMSDGKPGSGNPPPATRPAPPPLERLSKVSDSGTRPTPAVPRKK